MVTMTRWEHWENWAAEGKWTMLPYALKMKSASRLPSDWAHAWDKAHPYSFVLESGKDGRYTFLGLEPVSIIRGKGNSARIEDIPTGQVVQVEGRPLDVLHDWLRPFSSPELPGLPKFSGGGVGYLSYDVVRSLERLPVIAEDDLQIDDYIWMRMEEIWVFDHEHGEVYAIIHCPIGVDKSALSLAEAFKEAGQRASLMLERWNEIIYETEHGVLAEKTKARRAVLSTRDASSVEWDDILERSASISFVQEDFEAAVRRVQEYIAAGDVFQVNLSLRRGIPLTTSPEEVYEWLRLLNPSPYMGLLRFPDFQLVSASPELLVKLEQGKMATRPIAGTRRRGATVEEDEAMARELLDSEKERAEHIMLVDLLRNDLGRVSKFGTVRASELMVIEYYSHVMHLVSQVEGQLDTGKTPFDVIAAVFPGGTITGAPKVRTMEIIEELEPVTRGPYTGAMGWIDYKGNMELNIIIRTLIVKDGVGHIQVGAGIVIDSEPYREYRECHNKARAIVMAVGLSEEIATEGQGQGMKL
ncbi:anthranilate synthase component I family protein [Paenibacillus lentus]|uniref:Anthranilate synthase component I family protein n=1 Tax=Paenibacillus lentus TaxID=1338368 RepID=A0A3S8RRD2_9BACL|nr:anthranilate synthase component I family protein [Paenibacillus lentus]AZK45516.1 anthranilate synthase component I family protein [Paenibacillus lentus]